MTSIVINAGIAQAKLDKLAGTLRKPRPLFRAIAQILESETEANFAAQGRPSWAPLSKATLRARLKRNKGSSTLKILQDSGILAASVTSAYGDDYALVGANTPYAAIQQFGGTINRAPHSTKVRLRTDAKGQLLRQGDAGKLAVFAKDSHKRARESWHEVSRYSVMIPARPYLPFKGSGAAAVLQPDTEVKVLEVVTRMLSESMG